MNMNCIFCFNPILTSLRAGPKPPHEFFPKRQKLRNTQFNLVCFLNDVAIRPDLILQKEKHLQY